MYYTDGNKPKEIGNFKFTDTQYITQWANFKPDGSKAFISFGEALMIADSEGNIIKVSDCAQNEETCEGWIEFPVNTDGGMELCDGSDIRTDRNFDSFWYACINSDTTELYFYSDQKSQYAADLSSIIFYDAGGEVIYTDDDDALCKGNFKNNKFSSEEIFDDADEVWLGADADCGYITDSRDNLYYLKNGETERVTSNFNADTHRISVSGSFLAVTDDGSLDLYKDGEEYETVTKNDAETIYAYYSDGYFGSLYINEDEIIYSTDKNNIVKWTKDGKETLLKNIEPYSQFSNELIDGANAAVSSGIWNGSEFTVTTTQFGDAFKEYLEAQGAVSTPNGVTEISLVQFDKTSSAYGISFNGSSRGGNIYLGFRMADGDAADVGSYFDSAIIGTTETLDNQTVWLDAMYMSAQLMCFLTPEECSDISDAADIITAEIGNARDLGQTIYSNTWTAEGLTYQILMDFTDDGLYAFTVN